MNDFDYENLQKKRIAQGARHKVNGSKSKNCTMPSDLLTPSQKKALSGPCETYQLNKPMKFFDYRLLPDHIRKEYILFLRDKYEANNSQIYDMLGKSLTWWNNEARRLDLPKTTHGGNRRNLDSQKARWAQFLIGNVTEVIHDAQTEISEEQVDIEPPKEAKSDVKRFDITVNSDNAYTCIRELAQLASCVTGSVKIRLSIEVTD